MIRLSFHDIAITGVSCCVPAGAIRTESEYQTFGQEAVDKFMESTGVRERHISPPEQTAADLSFVAAERLLREKGISAQDIGALIFVSQTPDYKLPSTACVLQYRLGLGKDCVCYDVNLGCSGYVYGLQIVASLLANSNIKHALLLAGDTITKHAAPRDRSVCMLFGDAGSATLLEKQQGCSMDMAFRSDGAGFKTIIIPAGACRMPSPVRQEYLGEDGNPRTDCDLYMSGTDVFSFAFSEVPKLIKGFLQDMDKQQDDYDALVLHQANAYLMRQVAKRAKFPWEKVPISIDRYGNTSVASIPLTLCDAYGDTKEHTSKQLLLCGFGVGLSWGVVDVAISPANILPIMESDESYKEGLMKHD